MPFISLTAPPTAPDQNDLTTFNSRAVASVAWWGTHTTEMNAVIALLNAYTGVTGTYQFLDGAAASPAITFAGQTNTGFYRAGTSVIGVTTAGVQVAQWGGTGNYLMGSNNAITGIGPSRIATHGTTGATAQWAIVQNTANANGPTIALAKTRAAAIVDTYTIVNAGDNLANIEAWGADGATTIRGAAIQAYNIGTPAAGDVRAGWQFLTGSGAGTIATRLTIDDAMAAFTLPIKTPIYTVATLPATATEGSRAYVTDATTTTFGAAPVGGGSNRMPVYRSLANWFIG